jgi:large subunit ribosomal protein L21
MYAIVEMAGVQFKVAEAQKVRIPKVAEEPGTSIDFDRVLLVADKDKISVGKPLVAGAKVKAKVLSHGKDDKVLVYKKKSKKGYEKIRGHRQQFSEIQIEKITS